MLLAASFANAGEADLGTKVVQARDRHSTAILAVVDHPSALNLRVRSFPRQDVRLETDVRCRKNGRREIVKRNFVRRSDFVMHLNLSFRKPDHCDAQAFVLYPDPPGRGRVELTLYKR